MARRPTYNRCCRRSIARSNRESRGVQSQKYCRKSSIVTPLFGTKGISARDAVHAAVMLNNDVEWIATFDAGFDSISGIRRLKML